MTSNVHQLPLAKGLVTSTPSAPGAKVLPEHLDKANELKAAIHLDGNAELIWDRFIPRAIASKEIDKSSTDSWSSLCAKKLNPNLSESAASIWNNLIAIAISDGRFKELHSDVWKEYCIVRASMDDARDHLNSSTWTYEIEGRNGKQQKSKPEVAQLNETIRQWRWLVVQLGLGTKSENELKNTGAIQETLDLESFLPK